MMKGNKNFSTEAEAKSPALEIAILRRNKKNYINL
jgi:hypothetical protein